MPQHFKYILFPAESPFLCETPVLFPPWLEHAVVAAGLSQRMNGLPAPVSAGFVKLSVERWNGSGNEKVCALCYGSSDTLNLSSRPQDAEFIEAMLKLTFMNIQQRAVEVLQQIDVALALTEQATPGPWKSSPNYLIGGWWVQDKVAEAKECSVTDACYEGDATFIATSRTLLPASLRCLKTAIEGLLKIQYVVETSTEAWLVANNALTTLCDQWEARR